MLGYLFPLFESNWIQWCKEKIHFECSIAVEKYITFEISNFQGDRESDTQTEIQVNLMFSGGTSK